MKSQGGMSIAWIVEVIDQPNSRSPWTCIIVADILPPIADRGLQPYDSRQKLANSSEN